MQYEIIVPKEHVQHMEAQIGKTFVLSKVEFVRMKHPDGQTTVVITLDESEN